jgi:hypothetical protein
MLAALTAAAFIGSGGAHAQTTPSAAPAKPAAAAPAAPAAAPSHEIPQSMKIEHEDTVAQLTALTRRKGQVGVVARKALVLFKKHIAAEEAYIMPPLTLLPDLADGKATPDMAWAVAMTDRVKANREEIFQQHADVTDAMNELLAAATKAHDKAAADFAQSAVGDSLNDVEIMEPTVVLIGEYLRSKLPAAH